MIVISGISMVQTEVLPLKHQILVCPPDLTRAMQTFSTVKTVSYT